MNNINEIWKPVLNYEGFYEVSNLGRIRSLPNSRNNGKILTPTVNRFGYLYVSLYNNDGNKDCKIHRLVYEAFNGKTNLQIDHIIEGNKKDNRLCNLQAISCRENVAKYYLSKNKSSKNTGVTWRKDINKWSAYIYINCKRKHLGYFINEEDAANAYQDALNELLSKN